jgi:myo-inositol-1(or 4)-monophosphatase
VTREERAGGDPSPSGANERLDFALELAGEVGRLLLGFFGEADRPASRKKPDGSLITDADIAASELVAARVRERFKDHGVLIEEGMTAAPENSHVWVVDPLDGTTNFVWGVPIWGVSIALTVHGELQLGVVSFPALRRVYHAFKGGGAYLNDVRLRPAGSAAIARDHRLLLTCTNTLRRYGLQTPYKLRVLGSASYDLTAVAAGKAVGCMEHRPKVWDVAAGSVIIEEAGGTVGQPFTSPFFPILPKTDYRDISRPTLAACDPETYRSLSKAIVPIEPQSPGRGPSNPGGGVDHS